MRLLLLSFICLLLATSCNRNKSSFVISGNIEGLNTGNIIFVHRAGDDKVFDTVAVKNCAFKFTGKITEGMVVYTSFIEGKEDLRKEILIQNGDISLSAKSDSFQNAKVSGSASQDDYDSFMDQTKSMDDAMSSIVKQVNTTTDKQVADSLEKAYDKYDSTVQATIPGFVKSHSKSYASAFIIARNLLIDPKVEIIEPLYNGFDSTVQQSKYGKMIEEELKAAKKTSVGQVAPDFTLNDMDGSPLTLSSLRGKYVLLDFWASWCGPCRRENPNVVKAFNQFHDSGFDILGVSLDSKKDEWDTAVKKDSLTWHHVADLKGWGNTVAKLYGIRAIPANLLLDKDGKIIARNIMGDALEKKLGEVLK